MKRFAVTVIAALSLAAMVASSSMASPGSADLGVGVTADKTSYKVGDYVTYTVTITNKGEANADGVTFTDLLPAGLTPISTSVTSSPDTSGATITTSSVAEGQLTRDPVQEAINPTGDAYNAARIAEGARLDLGYDVGTSAGKTLITGQLGWLGSPVNSASGDSTETITIVAQATVAGQVTNVVSVDSSTNADPYSMNNYADTAVTVS
jgi:uncharacterized repeat protein (TIGR01451 family)